VKREQTFLKVKILSCKKDILDLQGGDNKRIINKISPPVSHNFIIELYLQSYWLNLKSSMIE